MGNCFNSNKNTNNTKEGLLDICYPIYYFIDNNDISKDIKIAKKSWNTILFNKSDYYFYNIKENSTSVHTSTCLSYFYKVFFLRLVYINTLLSKVFINETECHYFILKLLSLSFRDDKKFEQSMIEFSRLCHFKHSLKAIEFHTIGDVIFFSFKECLGDDEYNDSVHYSLVKVYSRCLSIIIPTMIEFEIENHSLQKNRRLRYINELKTDAYNSTVSISQRIVPENDLDNFDNDNDNE